FSTDPLAELRADPQADISDVHLNLTRPGALPETVDSTAVAGLAVLSPGQSATVARTATAPIPAAKADGETDATYLSRLSALDRRGWPRGFVPGSIRDRRAHRHGAHPCRQSRR